MHLTPHFTLDEMIGSDTAERLGIDNMPPGNVIASIRNTAEMMERIRAHLSGIFGRDVPIIVTSGYRCEALNRAIGSEDTSHHRRGWAVDFKAPSFGTPFEICACLQPVMDDIGIGQLIHEYGRWVHVSTGPVAPVNRVLTISARGKKIGIHHA